MILDLKFTVSRDPWTYGRFREGQLARRHKRSGAVQFILHKKGKTVADYTYEADFWTTADSSWWKTFAPFSPKSEETK
jgi:hypothetical protein